MHLLGAGDWFGSGSRIVITTRDPQLLSVLEVDNVYGEQGIEVKIAL